MALSPRSSVSDSSSSPSLYPSSCSSLHSPPLLSGKLIRFHLLLFFFYFFSFFFFSFFPSIVSLPHHLICSCPCLNDCFLIAWSNNPFVCLSTFFFFLFGLTLSYRRGSRFSIGFQSLDGFLTMNCLDFRCWQIHPDYPLPT